MNFFSRRLLFTHEKNKIVNILKNQNITHIIGVYPDLDFIQLAMTVAKECKIKFYPYLHDTIVESLNHKFYKPLAEKIQKQIFLNSVKIFVMSDGIKELYKNKYNIDSIPLLHTYSEEIKIDLNKKDIANSFFWGGSIYTLNTNSVKRINQICNEINHTLLLSAATSYQNMINLGFKMDNIKILPFLERDNFLKKIQSQKALILSIDWPEETCIHKDELSTVFPTKTIEYLLSGRPIIVHCHEDYFLSKFFKKNHCGLVINSTETNLIKNQVINFLEDKIEQNRMILNARKVVKQFHVSKVKSVLNKELII
tara:strand:+ start:5 stop:937 length:933 start_codon:yes stop_codon:yes gene_type:complete